MTFTARQSLLASFEQCPRRALLGMEVDDDITTGNVGASADLGSAFHAVAAEILRTLWRQGETQVPTQEAVEIMREVLANGVDHLNVGTGEVHRQQWVLPAQERDDLLWMVLGFCKHQWQPGRIMPEGTDVDLQGRRMLADIICPDGEMRTLTGQPDLILADPPDGVIIVDYKSGMGKPKAPRDNPDAEETMGKQYLSERGHFQLDSYGLLAMRKYPSATRATLRELHLRSGKVRNAVLGRDELEHVEYEVGLQLMLLDRAIAASRCPQCGGTGVWPVTGRGDAGGVVGRPCSRCDATGSVPNPLRKPRPGEWCARACPVAASCPVPAEQRGSGAIDGPETADEAAARFVVVDGLRNTLRDQLKAAYEGTGRPPEVGDGRGVFWREKPNGKGREFGVFDLDEAPRPPSDDELMAQLEASVAKAQAERGA